MMDNILSYLEWRGDLSFEQSPFNEIDSLICTMIGYVEWDDIVYDTAVYLNEACKKYIETHLIEDMKLRYAYSPMIIDFIKQLQDTPRFNQVKLKKYVSIFDKSQDVQFAAVTIELPNKTIYIAYRGTDCSILGWKEDLEMTYQKTIPSQQMAAEYLKQAYDDILNQKRWLGIPFKKTFAPLFIGGHSKGGNLAMYAATICKTMHPYIHAVHSFDGPGFREEFFKEHDFNLIKDKMKNYTPQGSIIGRLMHHLEEYVIFKGYSSGLQQHDAFYWQIDRDHFEYVDTFNKESDKVKNYIDQTILSKSDEEKKKFIQSIFKMLDEMKINHITDFTGITFKQGMLGIKELGNLGHEEVKLLLEVLKLAIEESKDFIFNKL